MPQESEVSSPSCSGQLEKSLRLRQRERLQRKLSEVRCYNSFVCYLFSTHIAVILFLKIVKESLSIFNLAKIHIPHKNGNQYDTQLS